MTDKNRRNVTPDDLADLDSAGSVPTYNAGSIYERTGKAAPTEVLPSAKGSEPTTSLTMAAPLADAPAPRPLGDSRAVSVPEVVDTRRDGAPARRGTIDLGLLLLRLLLGSVLVLDAVKTFFRLGGSAGISGLESQFADFPYASVLSVLVPTLELTAGVFLILGLLTPVAAMVAVVVTGFNAIFSVYSSGHGANVLAWDANVWLPVVLLGASLVLQFTGPGFYAVDAGRGWARRPLASSWIFALLGIVAAAVLWWFGTGVNPFA
ncbi:DoxX [Corynebacterium capitovis DSM 44611]|uniref:DoxX family protein n=1 Tax=Corynebacterium capitovis TaxID=131081 RepID=UPI000382F017|nr:DoxX family protein [Corynebacterium capitovis]WKD57805.1 DoxX [Corynebacterium capitovis DSM 44611]